MCSESEFENTLNRFVCSFCIDRQFALMWQLNARANLRNEASILEQRKYIMKVSGFCTTTRTTFCFYGPLRRGFYGVLRRLSTVYYVEFSQTKILLRRFSFSILVLRRGHIIIFVITQRGSRCTLKISSLFQLRLDNT